MKQGSQEPPERIQMEPSAIPEKERDDFVASSSTRSFLHPLAWLNAKIQSSRQVAGALSFPDRHTGSGNSGKWRCNRAEWAVKPIQGFNIVAPPLQKVKSRFNRNRICCWLSKYPEAKKSLLVGDVIRIIFRSNGVGLGLCMPTKDTDWFLLS